MAAVLTDMVNWNIGVPGPWPIDSKCIGSAQSVDVSRNAQILSADRECIKLSAVFVRMTPRIIRAGP
jgi:hypothetical protein